jgi:blue copper oxidase
VDDLPLAVQDKAFDGKNALDDSNSLFSGNGILGNQIVVNGTLDPYVDVSTELVRLRLLNASNARTFDFGFDDDRSFAMIGSDGGLLTSPYTTNRIMLTPGERAEIVVKVAPGERTVLRSYPPKLDGGVLNDRFSGGKDRFDVLQLRGAATLTASPALPSQLTTITRLDPARAATTRKLSMGENQINQLKMDMSRVDATVTVGTTEVWELSNLDSAPHNFHIHDVQFQVVSIGGAAPGPELMGWKDTMLVRPGVVTRIVMAFTDYADAHHAYMFHCHLLFHEDQGMMGQFVIVEPGQQASLDPDHQHS